MTISSNMTKHFLKIIFLSFLFSHCSDGKKQVIAPAANVTPTPLNYQPTTDPCAGTYQYNNQQIITQPQATLTPQVSGIQPQQVAGQNILNLVDPLLNTQQQIQPVASPE